MDGGFQLVSHKVQHTSPGLGPVHQTRPNRGVGLRRLGPWDSKTSSSREVSRDSHRLRHWTPDEPVDVLLTKADRTPPRRSVSPLPIADSVRSGSPSLPADSPCLSFARSPRSLITPHLGALPAPLAFPATARLPADCSSQKTHRATSALSFNTADRRRSCSLFLHSLASKPTAI